MPLQRRRQVGVWGQPVTPTDTSRLSPVPSQHPMLTPQGGPLACVTWGRSNVARFCISWYSATGLIRCQDSCAPRPICSSVCSEKAAPLPRPCSSACSEKAAPLPSPCSSTCRDRWACLATTRTTRSVPARMASILGRAVAMDRVAPAQACQSRYRRPALNTTCPSVDPYTCFVTPELLERRKVGLAQEGSAAALRRRADLEHLHAAVVAFAPHADEVPLPVSKRHPELPVVAVQLGLQRGLHGRVQVPLGGLVAPCACGRRRGAAQVSVHTGPHRLPCPAAVAGGPRTAPRISSPFHSVAPQGLRVRKRRSLCSGNSASSMSEYAWACTIPSLTSAGSRCSTRIMQDTESHGCSAWRQSRPRVAPLSLTPALEALRSQPCSSACFMNAHSSSSETLRVSG